MKANPNQKQIVQSISIFGSMHLIAMAISVFRSKIAALWLGSQGVGILGLFLSTINLIVSLVNVGLSTSLVRYLSGAEEYELSRKLTITQWVLLSTGVIGAVAVFLLAPVIAQATFQDSAFAWAFRWIAVSIFFKQLTTGYSSILQSKRKIKSFANANLIANVVGVMCTIPMYYFFKIDGIVYNILVVAIVEAMVLYGAYRLNYFLESKVETRDIVRESKVVLKSGFSFCLSNFIALLSVYVVQVFISKHSDYHTLGLYVSGFAVLNTYVALVFTVMGMDYFPRISKLKLGAPSLVEEVNNQFYIGMIVLMPILLGLLLGAPWVIKVLYSSEFLDTVTYIYIASLGVFLKLFSWLVGYVLISKGSNKMVMFNALIFNLLFVLLHCIGFYFYGLKGIAWCSSLYYLFHLLGNYFTVKKYFKVFIYPKNISKYIINALILILSILLLLFQKNQFLNYLVVGSLFVVSSVYSIKHLYKIYVWKDLK